MKLRVRKQQVAKWVLTALAMLLAAGWVVSIWWGISWGSPGGFTNVGIQSGRLEYRKSTGVDGLLDRGWHIRRVRQPVQWHFGFADWWADIPLWPFAAIAGVVAFGAARVDAKKRWRLRNNLCIECGYPLEGTNPGEPCSECGATAS